MNPDVADIDPTKSNTMAACLSAFGGLVLLPGLGHFYLGRWGRGLAFCGGYILSFLTVIGWIGVWIWAVVDANRLAQQAKKYHTWAATQGTPAQPAAALPPAPPAQPPPPPSA